MFANNPASPLTPGASRSSFQPHFNDASVGKRAGVGQIWFLASGRRITKNGLVRAFFSRENEAVETAKPLEEKISNASLQSSSSSPKSGISVKAVITIRKKMKETILEKIENQWESLVNGVGQGILIQLISKEIDPATNSGKRIESSVRGWSPQQLNDSQVIQFEADFTVPCDFGCPGAIHVTNFHTREFYLVDIVIHGFNSGPLFFPANTWIHSRKDNPDRRIIFRNQAYLPSQTPPGIRDLRREDSLSLRGNGKGERKPHDWIYDCEMYNDFDSTDKDQDVVTPLLGGGDKP